MIANVFLKGCPLEAKNTSKNYNHSVHIFWSRLASFGHLGVISDPLIVSKFHNETHDPKGQENKIYTIVLLKSLSDTKFYITILAIISP